MKYDPDRGCYVGKTGEEFHVTPFSNGSGYKYDYYDRSPYGNVPHNSTHVKSDLNENWSKTSEYTKFFSFTKFSFIVLRK